LRQIQRRISDDGSIKYVFGLDDGRLIETVRFTVEGDVEGLCISSQAGCNVGCRFCATGLQRPARNLTAVEIVDQVRLAGVDLLEDGIATGLSFVYFAGMGEAMHNYDTVLAASRQLLTTVEVPKVAISTSGVVPAIHRLADEGLPIKLHLSLHATTDEVRQAIIPLSRRWGIATLLDAGARFARRTGTSVAVNYMLLAGVNDSDEDIARLRELVDPDLFEVHLNRWNDIPGLPFVAVTAERVERFAADLRGQGLPATTRLSRGRDVGAGCGQLAGGAPGRVTLRPRLGDFRSPRHDAT
jgi:23S rRNA (adenine2503-C2)-methyltransferase